MPISSDPITYAIPIFFLLIGIELYINYREQLDLFERKDSWASLMMGLGSAFVGTTAKLIAFFVYTFLYQFAIFDIGWTWWAWLLILFADDFTFYWHHRLSHEIRLLWAAHINHHSSQKYNLTTALRQSWGEQLYKYIWWIWLPIIGFHPIMIMTMISISLIYQFFLHTETVKKLGFLEWFMNTPSHHRVHHAVNHHYLDRNHAGIFIIWDRLFGTFQEEDEEEPIYGITTNINTYNPLKIATHEFAALWQDVKNAKNWKDKLAYIFKPPGWSPNGEYYTAKYLREQWKAKQKTKSSSYKN